MQLKLFAMIQGKLKELDTYPYKFYFYSLYSIKVYYRTLDIVSCVIK